MGCLSKTILRKFQSIRVNTVRKPRNVREAQWYQINSVISRILKLGFKNQYAKWSLIYLI